MKTTLMAFVLTLTPSIVTAAAPRPAQAPGLAALPPLAACDCTGPADCACPTGTCDCTACPAQVPPKVEAAPVYQADESFQVSRFRQRSGRLFHRRGAGGGRRGGC